MEQISAYLELCSRRKTGQKSGTNAPHDEKVVFIAYFFNFHHHYEVTYCEWGTVKTRGASTPLAGFRSFTREYLQRSNPPVREKILMTASTQGELWVVMYITKVTNHIVTQGTGTVIFDRSSSLHCPIIKTSSREVTPVQEVQQIVIKCESSSANHQVRIIKCEATGLQS